MGKIVVGIDGSEGSAHALKWAVDEAKLRSAALQIVYSWQYPLYVTSEPIYIPPPDKEVIMQSANSTAERMIADAGVAAAGVPYTVETPQGRPGPEMVRLAADAELLVVGSRGAGSVRELLLGSVSNYCAHHATCPVVLVRPTE
ncbi:MAG: universal stress protein [Actinobacteria bacterium]|nr:universal stress protein [Actinomycetota bacterium]